jgi:hypothetical protein
MFEPRPGGYGGGTPTTAPPISPPDYSGSAQASPEAAAWAQSLGPDAQNWTPAQQEIMHGDYIEMVRWMNTSPVGQNLQSLPPLQQLQAYKEMKNRGLI